MATSASPVSTAPQATVKGTVVFVQGDAYLRDSSGKLTAIKPGDVVAEGDAIVTAAGAIVELQLPSGAKLSVGPERELLLNDELFATAAPERSENIVSSLGADADKVIQALNGGTDPFDGLEEPAAGVTGGGLGDQTHDFVRLVRILEEVTPVSYAYSSTTDGIDFLPVAGATTTPLVPANTPPVANTDATVAATEDKPVSIDVLGNDTDADGDPLTVTGATVDPAKGSVTVNADGTLTFTPAANVNGPVEITYTISDGKGGTSTATTTVDLAPVADAPVAVADLAATNEEQPVTFTVLGNDTDADGDTLTVTGASVDPLKGTVVVNADGTLTFTPAANINGPVEVTYTISDGKGGTSTAIATINVTPQNDAPVAANDTASTTEDSAVTRNANEGVLANDSDMDSTNLTVAGARTGTSGAFAPVDGAGLTLTGNYGSLLIRADGSYTYTPGAAAQALNTGDTVQEVFSYQMTDGQLGSTATLTISVAGTNDAPVIVGTLPDFNSSDALAVTLPTAAGFADPDAGDVLRFSASGLPAGLTIDPNTGLITGTLASDASVSGPYSITVTATDAAGSAVAQTFQLAVSNPGPTAVADTLALAESATQSGNVITGIGLGGDRADIDIDRDTLTVTLAGTGSAAPATAISATGTALAGTHGILTLKADGSYSYTATDGNLSNGQIVTDTFSYTVSDGQNGSATTTLTITVTGSNAAPATGPNAVTIAEDTSHILGAADFPFADSDANDSFSAVRIASLPSNGSLLLNGVVVTGPVTISSADLAAGKLSFVPDANENGLNYATFQFQVADPQGALSPAQTFTINVTPQNDAPVAANDTASTTEDSAVTRNANEGVLANDSDMDSTNLTVAGARTGTSGAFAPVDGAGLTLTGNYGSLLIRADGSYTYTPGAAAQALNTGDTVQEVFSYQMTDGQLGSTATLTISVAGTNDAPVIVGTLPDFNSSDALAVTLPTAAGFADPDAGDVLRFSASGLPAGLTIDPNTGLITGTLASDASVSGPYSITVTATDAAGSAVAQTFQLAVSNPGPTAVADTLALAESATQSGNVITGIGLGGDRADIDIDRDTLTVTLAGTGSAAPATAISATGTALAGTHGILTLKADGSYSYTATDGNLSNGQIVTDTFSYTVSDGQNGSATTTLTITVTGSNAAPATGPNAVTIAEDTSHILGAADFPFADSDANDSFSAVRIASLPSNGSLLLNGVVVTGPVTISSADLAAGKLSFVPDANENGLNYATFQFQVADPQGALSPAQTFTINVTPQNDAPVAANDSGAVTEDATLSVPAANGLITSTATPAGTDRDIDGDTLTVTAIRTGAESASGTAGTVGTAITGTYGTLTVQADGSYTYVANRADALAAGAPATDVFTYTVSDGTTTDTAELVITVTGTNDAPLVGSASVNVSEEGLAGGIADSTGNTDSTDLTVASGILSLTDADGNALVASLTAPVASLSSGGVPITWSGSGTQTLIGSANGVEILRATIASDGSYTVKLSGPVDHPDTTSEDVLSIALGVNVSDGVITSTSTLTVNVEDDSPIAAAASQTITVAPVDTNLLLMLDNSASMTRTDGVAGTTRLASAISALNTLLDRYDGFGEVRVRLVTFNTEAAAAGAVWTTVAQAKAQLAAIGATGGTNYDAAIAAGQSAYSSTGKLASGQNIAYFLSDGQPNTGTAIGAGDEAAWKGFLQSNQITSFALGMGTGATQAPLDPIAYNGVTNTNLNGQVISDFNQLSTALQATVPQPASGELLSGGLLGGSSGFGADGGSIRSVTVDGVTYNYNAAGSVTVSGGASHGSYNASNHQLTVSTAAGGTLAINMSTGSYTYTPISTISTKVTDGFSFVLADKDGDTGSSSITFDVSRLAENNIVLSSTTSAIAKASLGLTGEYYGYNETSNTTSTRFHADDKTLGNFDHVSDMTRIVDGRSGQTIVGTYNAATATGADATFSADKIDYGFGYTTGTTSVGAVDGNLGNNPTLLGSNLAINSGALYNFLRGGTTGSDSSELKTTTGIGNTTDSGMRMVGLVNLGGGSYDIRVTADDGFRLNIAGQTVAMFDNIQSPTARTYTNVSLAAGLQPIEILYWEQGGNARLRVEVKLSGEPDTGYKTLGTDEFALFTPTSAPTLNALQDIIEDPTQNGQWLIRTGSQIAGSNGNDDITGSDGRDDISGGAGNDIVRAGGGADLIAGGAGNDTLTGGLGSDTFKWSLADTVTTTKPAVDAITDFNTASAINGGDVLDLHDLLQGESQASGNLGNYLHFEKAGADTVVHVSSTGGYTGGTFVAGATDQKIVLQGVDLTNSGALSSDTQIIQDLLLKGKLHTD